MSDNKNKIKGLYAKTKKISIDTIVNTAVGTAFFTPCMMLYETTLLRMVESMNSDVHAMTLGESFDTRLSAFKYNCAVIPLMYALRNYSRKITHTTEASSLLRQTTVDTVSAYIPNVLLYYYVLQSEGKDHKDALLTAAIGTIYVGVLGFPFAKVLDYTRKKLGFDNKKIRANP